MTSRCVTELMQARLYLTRVLLRIGIEAEEMTAYRLIELIEYFAAHPKDYLQYIKDRETIDDQHNHSGS